MASSESIKICKYVVIRKKRNCRLAVVDEGADFCPEHQFVTGNANKWLRIPCPLDNKHTCYEHNLEKHLRICNAKPDTSTPYITKGVNLEKNVNENTDDLKLCDVTADEIYDLLKRINLIYSEHIESKITEKLLTHSLIEKEIENPSLGPKRKKHLHQASSILGLLSEYNFFQSDTCYIEFGAGRGQLSYWVYKTVESLPNTSVLLIERASQRHKFDNKLDNKDPNRVHRIRADISDLVLHKVDVINRTKSIVGLTKHLCGSATDLTIRCLMSCNETTVISGLLMAFCCHHRCQWGSYVGKDFFKKFNLSPGDFSIMSRLVSWATCGIRGTPDSTSEVDESVFRVDKVQLTNKEKEEAGRRCKNLIDWGRLVYLEEQGFNCFLHHYVSLDISLENVCIVALKQ